MEFLVLGEVGARSAGQPVDCGPLRQRSAAPCGRGCAGRPVVGQPRLRPETRGYAEVEPALARLVAGAAQIRATLH